MIWKSLFKEIKEGYRWKRKDTKKNFPIYPEGLFFFNLMVQTEEANIWWLNILEIIIKI